MKSSSYKVIWDTDIISLTTRKVNGKRCYQEIFAPPVNKAILDSSQIT